MTIRLTGEELKGVGWVLSHFKCRKSRDYLKLVATDDLLLTSNLVDLITSSQLQGHQFTTGIRMRLHMSLEGALVITVSGHLCSNTTTGLQPCEQLCEAML